MRSDCVQLMMVEWQAILDRFPADSFRLYLIEEATYGEDLAFQLENMIKRYDPLLLASLEWVSYLSRCVLTVFACFCFPFPKA